MPRLGKGANMDQRIIDLYDEYTHAPLERCVGIFVVEVDDPLVHVRSFPEPRHARKSRVRRRCGGRSGPMPIPSDQSYCRRWSSMTRQRSSALIGLAMKVCPPI